MLGSSATMCARQPSAFHPLQGAPGHSGPAASNGSCQASCPRALAGWQAVWRRRCAGALSTAAA